MEDRLMLAVTGGILALLAWAFWHYLGEDAFSVLSTAVLIGIAIDNVRLRRQLRNSATSRRDSTLS
jgi:predicted membrane-bound mannosyltransferase